MSNHNAPRNPGNASPDRGAVARDSFENLSHDEVRGYVSKQINRLNVVSKSLSPYGHSNEWETGGTHFEGGREYADLAADIARNGEISSTDARLALLYVDSMIVRDEALASVNTRKIVRKFNLTDDTMNALGLQLDEQSVKTDHANRLLLGNIENQTNADGTPTDENDIERMEDKIRANKGLIKDSLVGAEEMRDQSQPDLPADFIREVQARESGHPTMSDEEFEQARVDIARKMSRNIRIARALTNVSRESSLRSPRSPYSKNELIANTMDVARSRSEAFRYAHGINSLGTIDPDPDMDDDTVTTRLGAIGSRTPATPATAAARTRPGTTPAPDATGATDPAARRARTPEATSGISRLDLQKIRVQNAADELQKSGRGRSKKIGAGSADHAAGTLHDKFNEEVYKLMQMERPPVLDDPATTPEEKNAFIAQYAFEKYHDVTQKTVEGMGGEKDPKKRKRNQRIIRFGLTAVGLAVGGPAGAAVAGAIGLGITKALNSEMKGREKLKESVTAYDAQNAADVYLENTDQPYDEYKAFTAASKQLQANYEKGTVRRRRWNIGFAAAKGALWTGGSIFVAGQALQAAHVVGDSAFQMVSKASWSGTGAPWQGGLNPNFNYTMHEKPISWKVLEGLWKVGTGRY